jgi:CheY-like chemotaxis protein/HPt (histidine-containing phosphotransfer) domain-containing protein
LKKLGYQADVAANGLEVLDALARQPYEVVLMDLQMPEMDGLETMSHLRRRYPAKERPIVIAVTANALIGDRETCLAAGMDDYLSKPIRTEALQAALARCHPQLRPVLAPLPVLVQKPGPVIEKTEPAALDLSVLLEAADGDETSLVEVIEVLLKSLPTKLTNLQASIAAKDARQVALAAHTLRSDCAFFSQAHLNELCYQLERAGHTQELGHCADLFNQLVHHWQPIQHGLQAILGEAGPAIHLEMVRLRSP